VNGEPDVSYTEGKVLDADAVNEGVTKLESE
jgi:hypothetical protein